MEPADRGIASRRAPDRLMMLDRCAGEIAAMCGALVSPQSAERGKPGRAAELLRTACRARRCLVISQQQGGVRGTRRPAAAAGRARRASTRARWAKMRARTTPAPAGRPARRAEGEASPDAAAARRRRPAGRARARAASDGARAKVEVTTRNSLMKMPKGGRPAMATTPATSVQPSSGWLIRSGRRSRRCAGCPSPARCGRRRRRSPIWSGCAWSSATGRRNCRAGRPCRRRRR